MRRMLIGTALACLVAVAHGQTAVRSIPGVSAVRLLGARVTQVNFDQAPLVTVFEALGKALGTNVVVQWEQLEAAGVQRETPVSLTARNLRVSQVFWLILNEASDRDVKLAYRADRDMILVSTLEDLSREMVVKVYDVSDLLAPRIANPSLTIGREHDIVTGLTPVVANGAVGVQPVLQRWFSGLEFRGEDLAGDYFIDDDGRERVEFDRERLMRELIDAIVSTIEPDSWNANGGLGSIVAFNGRIVVRNSPLVHQKIGGPLRTTD